MGVQFILFLGVDMGIGILLARRSGIWSRLLAAPVTLTTVLLARAASAAIISPLASSEKGFYAMSFVLSLFAAVTVQKNVRDVAGAAAIAH
jgi:hypothetical protein